MKKRKALSQFEEVFYWGTIVVSASAFLTILYFRGFVGSIKDKIFKNKKENNYKF